MPTKRSGCAISWPVLIIITIFASLLAAGLFLGIPYLQGRPEFPRGKFQRVVEGNQIMVEMDPDQEVYLIGLPGEVDSGIGGQIIGQLPTATPAIIPTWTPVPPTLREKKGPIRPSDAMSLMRSRLTRAGAMGKLTDRAARHGEHRQKQESQSPARRPNCPISRPS